MYIQLLICDDRVAQLAVRNSYLSTKKCIVLLSDYKVESSRKIRELGSELAISKAAEEDAKKQVSMAKVRFVPLLINIFLYVCMYVCTIFYLR